MIKFNKTWLSVAIICAIAHLSLLAMEGPLSWPEDGEGEASQDQPVFRSMALVIQNKRIITRREVELVISLKNEEITGYAIVPEYLQTPRKERKIKDGNNTKVSKKLTSNWKDIEEVDGEEFHFEIYIKAANARATKCKRCSTFDKHEQFITLSTNVIQFINGSTKLNFQIWCTPSHNDGRKNMPELELCFSLTDHDGGVFSGCEPLSFGGKPTGGKVGGSSPSMYLEPNDLELNDVCTPLTHQPNDHAFDEKPSYKKQKLDDDGTSTT